MSKQWVVCIDGTSNRPGQTTDAPGSEKLVKRPTNVANIWTYVTNQFLEDDAYGVVANSTNNTDVEAVYLRGVGSGKLSLENIYDDPLGVVFGYGTSERIRDAYRYLARRWMPDDSIYLFGFSRGAFAVRSLAGFIDAVGLPVNNKILPEELINELYETYRAKKKQILPGFKKAEVTFVGIWDTVAAIPCGETINSFHSTSPENVKYVAHALAIDEERTPYNCVTWDFINSNSKGKEVWFKGAHCNVGGSYIDENLSNITLFWMLREAETCGLSFHETDDYMDRFGNESQYRPVIDSSKAMFGPVLSEFRELVGRRTTIDYQLVHQTVIDAINKKYDPAIPVKELMLRKIEPWVW